MLDKRMIHVSGRAKMDGIRFHPTTQNGSQFKKMNCLSRIFHLIFSVCSWLQVMKTKPRQAKPWIRGDYCILAITKIWFVLQKQSRIYLSDEGTYNHIFVNRYAKRRSQHYIMPHGSTEWVGEPAFLISKTQVTRVEVVPLAPCREN